MNRQQILDLYDWADGTCFRHPGEGTVPTAHIKTIRPAAGGIQDVRACRDCVMEMAERCETAGDGRELWPDEP